jgi:peptidoglycan/LPS O-acetylase OafA/YrhL
LNATAASSPRPPAPRQVLIAICLMGAVFMLAMMRSVLMKDWSHPRASVFGVIVLGVICFFWIYGLFRGLNWVWWITVILGVGGCILAPLSVSGLHEPIQIYFYWLQFALTAPAMILFLLPAARLWYKRPATA